MANQGMGGRNKVHGPPPGWNGLFDPMTLVIRSPPRVYLQDPEGIAGEVHGQEATGQASPEVSTEIPEKDSVRQKGPWGSEKVCSCSQVALAPPGKNNSVKTMVRHEGGTRPGKCKLWT